MNVSSQYSVVLVAVDLSTSTDYVIQRALELAEAESLHLVYVMDVAHYANAFVTVPIADVETQIREHVKAELHSLIAKYSLKNDAAYVVTGHPASQIHALADKIGADLIVVGSHGRHGIQLLLGSTANGVLHGAKCDVLAVRVDK